MTTELPEYYFRIRDNGAFVFRIDTENRQRRIEMDQIATLNIKNGEVKPHGDGDLSDADRAAIGDWMATRKSALARRSADSIERTVEHLNLTAHWAQARANDADRLRKYRRHCLSGFARPWTGSISGPNSRRNGSLRS